MGTCASAYDDNLLALVVCGSLVLGGVEDGSTVRRERFHSYFTVRQGWHSQRLRYAPGIEGSSGIPLPRPVAMTSW
jgi:hypothetical protein